MTTSGVTEWSMTARDLCRMAMVSLSVLPAGGQPSAQELTDCLVVLNGMLKSWETRGYSLWRQDTISVSVTAATNPTTLATSVYDVEAARYVNGTTERPLTVWDRDQYKILPNKANQGNPSIYYVDRQRDTVDLYLWPVPSANATLSVDVLRKIETVTDASQTLDVPQDWQETIYVLLAVRIASMFGVPVPDELAMRAQTLQAEIDAQDRPASYFMGPFN